MSILWTVSILSRIKVTDEEVLSLTEVSCDYFRACALSIGHCVSVHTKQIRQQLGVGLEAIQWRAENLNMSLSPDLHKTPSIQHNGCSYSGITVICLNTYQPIGMAKECRF